MACCPSRTGSDGGGSIRIPAGFCGLFGLKATYGRVPQGPDAGIQPLTSVMGCLTRSVRDTARYFDACNGFDQRAPLSLTRVSGWEEALGSFDLAGKTVAILPELGTANVRTEVADVVVAAAERVAKAAGLRVVEVIPHLPPLRGQWAMAGQVSFVANLGSSYPGCIPELSDEMRFGLESARQRFDLDRERPSKLGDASSTRPWPTCSKPRTSSWLRPTLTWRSQPKDHRLPRSPVTI